MKDAIVVGGGLGGLIVGADLKRRGKDVLVLEATDTPAGVAATVREDGFLLEPGAGSLLWPNADLEPIFAAAGIETAANQRIVQNRRASGIRISPLSGRHRLRVPRRGARSSGYDWYV